MKILFTISYAAASRCSERNNYFTGKDIKKLSVEQLSVLAEEVRTAFIRKLSEHSSDGIRQKLFYQWES